MIWPFKKRKQVDTSSLTTFNTVLCIPGAWRNLADITDSIFAASNGDHVLIGDVLVNAKAAVFYKLEIEGRDERVKNAFRDAGHISKIPDELLDKIEKHTFVLYLSGKTSSLADAYHLSIVAAALLNAGGFGVKIETTGKAFEKDKWLRYLASYDESNLFEMFVINSNSDQTGNVWSRGMQNLGLRDTITSGMEHQRSVDLITMFGFYQIFDKPLITAGKLFKPDADAPGYKITAVHEQPYKTNPLFANPFGMWRLTELIKAPPAKNSPG